MKKIILLTILTTAFSFLTKSQNCLQEGIEFTSQEQIDNFSLIYPDCKIIEGYVTIGGEDINNLNGLSQLTKIEGYLSVGHESHGNPSLLSLTGLENLDSILGGLIIHENHQLADLSGLSNLVFLDVGLFVYYNQKLESFFGLDNIERIKGSIHIQVNNSLTSLGDLDKIESGLTNDLLIEDNNSLSSCAIEFICDLLSDSTTTYGISNNKEGCNTSDEVKTSCDALSIEVFISYNKISVYPNPTSKAIYISNPNSEAIYEINIYNQSGKKLIHEKFQDQRIDVSSFRSGLYIVELLLNNRVKRVKLIIE
jgi:hypothetical protein